MVRVPTYQRQAATPRPRADLSQVTASPTAFGVQQSQAIAQAGATVQQSALQVGGVFADMQKRQDENDALEAFNQFNDKMRTLMEEGDDAYSRQQGRNAAEAYQRLPEDIERIASEIRSGLNPRAAEVFGRVADRKVQTTLDSYASYARRQADEHQARQVQALRQSMLNEYLEDPLGPMSRGLLNIALDEMMLMADRQDLGAEERRLIRDEFLTEAHAGALDRLLSEERFEDAESYFGENGLEMVGKARDQARRAVQGAGIKRRARDIVLHDVWPDMEPEIERDNVQATESAGIARIQGMGLPVDVEDEAIRRFQIRLRQHAGVLEERQAGLVQTASDIIHGPATEAEVRAKVETMSDLDARSRAEVNTMITRRFAPQDIRPSPANEMETHLLIEAILEGEVENIEALWHRINQGGLTASQARRAIDQFKQWDNGQGPFVPMGDIKRLFADYHGRDFRWDSISDAERSYIIERFQREARRQGRPLTDQQAAMLMLEIGTKEGRQPRWRIEARGADIDPARTTVPAWAEAEIRAQLQAGGVERPTRAQIAEEFTRQQAGARAIASRTQTEDIALARAEEALAEMRVTDARRQVMANLGNAPESVRRIVLEEGKRPTAEEWPNRTLMQDVSVFKFLQSIESVESAATRRQAYAGLPDKLAETLNRGQAYISELDRLFEQTGGDYEAIYWDPALGSNTFRRHLEDFVPEWTNAVREYFAWKRSQIQPDMSLDVDDARTPMGRRIRSIRKSIEDTIPSHEQVVGARRRFTRLITGASHGEYSD